MKRLKQLKHYLEASVVLFGIVVYAIACTKPPFTPAETALIGSVENGIMPTLTVENPDDSLFLHQKSRILSRRQARSAELTTLKERMLMTVTDPSTGGVGLAAPQVGIPYKLIVVKRFDLEGEPWRFYLNPEITHYSDTTEVGEEGCFSVATRRGAVRRSTSVTIRYYDDESFRPRTETVEGFTAVIFQHEIDHLEGILFIDRIDEIQDSRLSPSFISALPYGQRAELGR